MYISPMPAYLNKLKATCAALSVGFSDDGETLRIDAPVGQVLASTGLHFVDQDYDAPGNYWDRPTRRRAAAMLAEDLASGLEPCSAADCDVCHSN